MSHRMFGVCMVFCAAVCVTRAPADTVYVSGTITDDTGSPVADAAVTVRSGLSATVSDTTGGSGTYAVTTTTSRFLSFIMVSAGAEGYTESAKTVTVEDPNDSIADSITVNLTLRARGGTPSRGDTVRISGTVKDSADGTPVANAVVISRLDYFRGVTGRDTADASGNYEIVLVNTGGRSTVRTGAEAPGYRSSPQYTDTIKNPSDGKTDAITRDIRIPAIVYDDTVTVDGSVVDSATRKAIPEAVVVIEYRTRRGTFLRDTVATDAAGAFSASEPVPSAVDRISYAITASGYRATGGRKDIGNDNTVHLDTISLEPYTVSDTLRYRVSGLIIEAGGSGPSGARAVVTMTQAGTTVFTDTVGTSRASGGRSYRTSWVRLPYKAGDMTVSVSVIDRDGEQLGKETVTVPSSTTSITVNVMTGNTGARHAVDHAIHGHSRLSIVVYSVDGRVLRRIDNVPAGRLPSLHRELAGLGRAMLIVSPRATETGITRQRILPAR